MRVHGGQVCAYLNFVTEDLLLGCFAFCVLLFCKYQEYIFI